MTTIVVNVDEELVQEYLRHYHDFCRSHALASLDEKTLIEAFVHDRLCEEIEYMVEEAKLP